MAKYMYVIQRNFVSELISNICYCFTLYKYPHDLYYREKKTSTKDKYQYLLLFVE